MTEFNSVKQAGFQNFNLTRLFSPDNVKNFTIQLNFCAAYKSVLSACYKSNQHMCADKIAIVSFLPNCRKPASARGRTRCVSGKTDRATVDGFDCSRYVMV